MQQAAPTRATPSRTKRASVHAPKSTIITIPCHNRQHRLCVTPHGTLRFLDHRHASVRLEALLEDPTGCAAVHHAGTRHLDDRTLPENISSAFEAQYRMLRDEVDAEWQRCWHNATLRTLPYDDNEAELFWEHLGQAVHDACRDLSAAIYARYGHRLTFHQYGRSGATIAPHEWMGPAPGNQFGSFHGPIDSHGDHDYRQEFPQIQEVLAILRYINAYWRNLAASIDTWWVEEQQYLKA